MTRKVSLLIPTYNGGERWLETLEGIKRQNFIFHQKIIIDSGSTDQTVPFAKKYGFEAFIIDQKEFNHGATRQLLAESAADADVFVYMTQDAIPCAPDSFSKLIEAFEDNSIGLAYGRQLPHENAEPVEAHLRLFNYPEYSERRTFKDKYTMGFKVFFCSNSFAAYRKDALADVGGFPANSIMGEDAIVAAKMLRRGYNIAYVAQATVRHSHSYSFKEDFKRYFDTRVFHEQNPWLIQEYGRPSGEGLKYVKSEIAYVFKNHPLSLLNAFSSSFAKWSGYTLGRYYKWMPAKILKKLSMHPTYWKQHV